MKQENRGGGIQVKQKVKEKASQKSVKQRIKYCECTTYFFSSNCGLPTVKNRKRYSSCSLTRIFQFLSIQIAFVVVLSHEKTGSSHIPLVRSIGSSFKRETCVSGGNLIKIYTNQCQVVNGKKQCPVYCNGRGTFDQQTSGYYVITIYTIIEKTFTAQFLQLSLFRSFKWLCLLTLRYC